MISTLCVAMGCKNEAHVILRALKSAEKIADAWCIIDTGSTDGTQAIVRAWLDGKPHLFLERPWVGWPENFSDLLTEARPLATHTLILDADEIAEPGPTFDPHALSADYYQIRAIEPGADFPRAQMVGNHLPWRYTEPLHCYLTTEGVGPPARADLVLRSPHDGARSRDPETYRRDAEVLEKALADEPDHPNVPRRTFYLAQSYRDCGEREKAIELYRRRVALGGWAEEAWFALYQIAVLTEELGRDPTAEYLAAYNARPIRAEPLVHLARYYRQKDQYFAAYLFAHAAYQIARPVEGLFVDPSVYDWRAADELSVAASWTGHIRQGHEVIEKLVASGKVPESRRERIEANAQFYRDRIGAAA